MDGGKEEKARMNYSEGNIRCGPEFWCSTHQGWSKGLGPGLFNKVD